MKSCSTIKADLPLLIMNLFIALAVITLYSASRYAEGSSIRYTSAGLPKAIINATFYISPPESFYTWLSMIEFKFIGLHISDVNLLFYHLFPSFLCKSSLTLPTKEGLRF